MPLSRFQRITLRFNVLLFRALHIMVTIVIWQHHFYLKYRLQEGAVPKAAPNYYWKLYVCVPCANIVGVFALGVDCVPCAMFSHKLPQPPLDPAEPTRSSCVL